MKISIITVTYNDLEGLKKTINSVLNQTYYNIEYIIIDGNSNDGTKEFLNTLNNNKILWKSEIDKGIYDAMNKGIQLANGDFIYFLNSSDVLYKSVTIEKIMNKIIDKDALYYGRAKIIGNNENISWIYPDYKVKDFKKWLKFNLPNHQTIFFPKKFYKKYKYDLKLKLTADDDYKLLAIKSCNTYFIDEICVEFKRDGVSSNHKDFNLFKQRLKESFIRNYKHHRWIRFFIDPFKLILMYMINSLFGDKFFLKFIKVILKLKR